MPNKLTGKQLDFARVDVELGNGQEAYKAVYAAENMNDKSISVEVAKLRGDPRIALEQDRIRAELNKATQVTLEKLNGRNEQIWHLSCGRNADGTEKEDKTEIKIDTTAMQKNVESQAKLNGLVIDRKEFTGKNGEPLNVLDKSLLAAVLTDEAKKKLGFQE